MIQIKTDKIEMIIQNKNVFENMLNEFIEELFKNTHTDANIKNYKFENNILTVMFTSINTILFHSRELNNTLQFDLNGYDEIDADLLFKLYKEQERKYIQEENKRKLEEFKKADAEVLRKLEEQFGPL